MIILAIETSCDETSIAIMANSKIVYHETFSQIFFHAKFGGVIPEMASRMHFEKINYLLEDAKSKHNLTQIDYISYTSEPGLIGCLQIGRATAEAISIAINKPIIPINHLHGHIFSANINNEFVYPVLATLVSGGHTQVLLVDENLKFEVIVDTRDDAAGEIYDKVARAMGLEYPGGPLIDKMAQKGTANISFSQPMKNIENEFSFSGLKTAAITYLKNKGDKIEYNDFAASFQKTVVDSIISKTQIAIKKHKPNTIVLAGGVAANSLLRQEFVKLHKNALVPKMEYCTDNAAMIAKVCEVRIQKNIFESKG